MRTLDLRVMQIIKYFIRYWFYKKMFMFFFLLRFINSTISFEQVIEVLKNGSLYEQVLNISGVDIN